MDYPFDPRRFEQEVLKPNGITKAFGVPDSNLSGLLNYLSATKSPSEHTVVASEGGAVALAAGFHLSTGKIALVYLQNSGFGHALNPLQSLAAKEVSGVPMLVMIGWRGKPGVKDEPQHALSGPRLLDNLRANDFPFEQMPETLTGARESISRLVSKSFAENTPVVLIVSPKSFLEYNGQALQRHNPTSVATQPEIHRWMTPGTALALTREDTIRCVLRHIKPNDVTVCSLGGSTRELYMIRKENTESLERDFLCIGAMGHAFALACGVSLGFDSGRVFCIDGDGSFLMHLGNNAVLAGLSYHNVIHIVVYNATYNSTGNQPLMMRIEDFITMACALPYKRKFLVDSEQALEKACKSAEQNTLIFVAVNKSARENLPRPSESPQELKRAFMKSINKC